MKRRLTCALLVLCLALTMLVTAPIPVLALDGAPKNVINNFGKDPKTEHNFTWNTSTPMKTEVLEYCAKNKFNGFDKMNIISVTAQSYKTKTDLDERVIYKVALHKLKPGTEYIYRVGNGINSYSSQGVFKTAEQDIDEFTFINITDTQGTTAKDYAKWGNTLDKALQKFPTTRFLIHTGDMVDLGEKINQWDLFSNAVKSQLMNLPIAPTVGNHEVMNKNNTNSNAKNFTDRFNLPEEKDTGAPTGTVYSYDYGNAHIAIMNTQCGSKNLKKQADWLRRDMKSTQKAWKIVALHRGPYGATTFNSDIKSAWVPAFDELGIDLVLQGNDHNYVRSYPMKKDKRVEDGKGTIYMLSNSGGVKFYPKMTGSWQALNLQPFTQMYIAVTVKKDEMAIAAYDVKNSLRDAIILKK